MNKFIFLLPFVLSGQRSHSEIESKLINPTKNSELIRISQKIHPGGAINFGAGTNMSEAEILSKLRVSDELTFKLARENQSRFNSDVVSRYYEQYYKGVIVETGGYIVQSRRSDGKVRLFNPRIFEGINVDVSSAVDVEDCLSRERKNTYSRSELVISNLFTKDYRLLHKVYYGDHSSEICWIDARTKEEIQCEEIHMHLNGDTPTYGTVSLNDDLQGNTTILQTPDQSVRVYQGQPNVGQQVTPAHWTTDYIPTTTNTDNWGSDASPLALQSLYVTDQVAPLFSTVGIDFGTINIATQSTAYAIGTIGDNSYIVLGTIGGNSASLYDIVAHELGHLYLIPFIWPVFPTNGGQLHEGISDVFGIYIESLIQGNVDWVNGDDDPVVAAVIDRDQSKLACLTDMPFLAGPHELGLVMGHWFYIVSTGDLADDIPALGMETALEIIMESVESLTTPIPSYDDMRTATVLVAEMNFGLCSEEYKAVVNAWDRVCVPGPSEVCDADFLVKMNAESDGSIYFTFENEDNPSFEHSWTVVQHDAIGSGPYTQVAQSSDPEFVFEGTFGGCYTFVHQVTTACGSCCYTRTICNKKGGEKDGGDSNVDVDCDILCNLKAPENLVCNVNEEGFIVLSWDAIPGATGYGISFTFNDTDCCKPHPLGTWEYETSSTTNSIQLNFYPSCMSWTVTPTCKNGNGQTSAKACYNAKAAFCGEKKSSDAAYDDLLLRHRIGSNFNVFPNPSTGVVNYSINLSDTDRLNRITILDLSGKVIKTKAFELTDEQNINGAFDFEEQQAGVYLVQVQFESKVLTQKVMLVK